MSDPRIDASGKAPGIEDIAMIRGHEHVKRALEIAVSGGHHILLCGPADSQKRLLAQATPSLFPLRPAEETLDGKTASRVTGHFSSASPIEAQPPFRALSPLCSEEELIGSAEHNLPGELSLAHQGVLFLDELPGYKPWFQELVCQAIEQREVTISYAGMTLVYPVHILLIASIQPCPCGFHMDVVNVCNCSKSHITSYQRRISTRLLNLIDISIEVPRIDVEKLTTKRYMEPTQVIRSRVQAAQERQLYRFAGTALARNAEMSPLDVENFCQIEPVAKKLLQGAMQQLQLREHTVHQVLKVACTIADLAESESIAANHIAEAIQYRLRIPC